MNYQVYHTIEAPIFSDLGNINDSIFDIPLRYLFSLALLNYEMGLRWLHSRYRVTCLVCLSVFNHTSVLDYIKTRQPNVTKVHTRIAHGCQKRRKECGLDCTKGQGHSRLRTFFTLSWISLDLTYVESSSLHHFIWEIMINKVVMQRFCVQATVTALWVYNFDEIDFNDKKIKTLQGISFKLSILMNLTNLHVWWKNLDLYA